MRRNDFRERGEYAMVFPRASALSGASPVQWNESGSAAAGITPFRAPSRNLRVGHQLV
jgi:hypothetical protein